MSGELRRTLSLASLPLLMLLAACAGSDADDRDMRVDAGGAMDTTPAGTAAPPSLAGIAGDVQRHAQVVLREWAVEPAGETLPAGEITFQAMNTGTMPHRLALEGPRVRAISDTIAPGSTASLRVDLPAGTYRLFCPDSSEGGSHAGRGMSTPFVIR